MLYNDMALLAWRGPGYLAQAAAVSGRDLFLQAPARRRSHDHWRSNRRREAL